MDLFIALWNLSIRLELITTGILLNEIEMEIERKDSN